MERRERITTSQGLGIRTPERGLGPLFSLVVVLLLRDNGLIGCVLSFGANLSCCGCSQGAWDCTVVIVSIIGLKP